MSRVFWFAAGAASGIYTLVKARRAAEVLTPDGLGARVAALGAGAKVFVSEVATGMAERESEIRARAALNAGADPRGGDPAAALGPAGDRSATHADVRRLEAGDRPRATDPTRDIRHSGRQEHTA